MHLATPISVHGTPEEIGRALGEHAQKMMHEVIVRSKVWLRLMQWHGHPVISRLIDAAQKTFPSCCDELYGMSVGLGMHFDEIFIWNCRAELLGISAQRSSTLAWNRLDARSLCYGLGHGYANEGEMRLAMIQPDGMPGFTTLWVPGDLPGNTISVTASGIVHAVDNLEVTGTPDGMPNALMSRAMLGTSSFVDAIELLLQHHRFGGAHHVLGSANEFVMFSIEMQGRKHSIVPIASKYAHTNHPLHKGTQVATGRPNEDSGLRLKALLRLLETLPSHPHEDDIDHGLLLEKEQHDSSMPSPLCKARHSANIAVALVTASRKKVKFSVRSLEECAWHTQVLPVSG